MEVRIQLFGVIAELLGNDEMSMTGVKDIESLKQNLAELNQKVKETPYSTAINETIIHENQVLSNGDVVAIIPMFEGG